MLPQLLSSVAYFPPSVEPIFNFLPTSIPYTVHRLHTHFSLMDMHSSINMVKGSGRGVARQPLQENSLLLYERWKSGANWCYEREICH